MPPRGVAARTAMASPSHLCIGVLVVAGVLVAAVLAWLAIAWLLAYAD
jgi:hypothetical protein